MSPEKDRVKQVSGLKSFSHLTADPEEVVLRVLKEQPSVAIVVGTGQIPTHGRLVRNSANDSLWGSTNMLEEA
jgi:hypothetical protein